MSTDAVSDWIRLRVLSQHQAENAPELLLAPDFDPEIGPISFYPSDSPAICKEFIHAIESAGGEVLPLNAETRGLVWLARLDAAEMISVLSQHAAVQWVQLPMAGIGSSFIREAHIRPIIWTCAKGAFAEPVAEHAVALTLAALRDLKERSRAETWGDSETGRSLYGKKVLIIGAGGIGAETARLLAPFRVAVLFVRKHAVPAAKGMPVVSVDEIDQVLPAADVVVLAAPLTDSSYRLINKERLAMLKAGAVIVNVGRGGLIDTEAMAEALKEKPESLYAALDVTDPEPLPDNHPLWSLPNCLITPHAADTVDMCVPLLAERIHRNVLAFLGKGPWRGLVSVERGY
eukprot:Protomagalhaensia_sp_Gyna_25__1151@NODE_1565_length_1728_cov_28_905861_g1272_i0_p1_GENE_NODE_1565_length_1728_cov_28_905861_g1272_i0NODE_1565_length_1728_cov_28_905861_g1272_i0_p1_ORF_typecomplete_len358_score51_862Hacid_dh_C/PF02826_19/1_8e032Hacid_dh_C/PF02826_19/1_4e492Hacid_dh/PF00389_30/9_8e30AdoHcyase_NAD/PF00670_21/2_7e09AlaDh_PNT_C/PF01262_21/5e07Shikimate_DH/PF01488_20/3_2e06THF_DHG_CYH_C/PF02882_19/1_9e05NAD_binding_2/PF03446_15/6_3e05Pyr_redox_2/PF07992_14/7_1e05NAD_binding_7/PF13241_